MPGMLGWFKMTPETSIEDIEWLLARSAAFNAGYAFVTNHETIAENGNSDKILQMIGDWEKLRIAGLFSEEQKRKMEDIAKEFSLEKVHDKEYSLVQVFSSKFNLFSSKFNFKIRVELHRAAYKRFTCFNILSGDVDCWSTELISGMFHCNTATGKEESKGEQ